jgi:copper chaperone CopZ
MDYKRKNAVIDLEGARCASCSYTIEHLGRKIPGIHSIRVDSAKGEIHVDYEGNRKALEDVTEIVQRIGYNAVIRTPE